MATEQKHSDDPSCIYCDEEITEGEAFIIMVQGSMTSEGDEVVNQTEHYCHWPVCAEELAGESVDELDNLDE